MNKDIENEIEEEQALKKVCKFFRLENPAIKSCEAKDAIKEVCVIRLCKEMGLSKFDHKSDFFDFFSSVMGEAVCLKLNIQKKIACDELRLVKYDHINLVQECKSYLDKETITEAFIDAFDLIDKYKYLIPTLKKV